MSGYQSHMIELLTMMFKLIAMIHWIAVFWNYLNYVEEEYW